MGAHSFINLLESESFRLPGGYRLEYRKDTPYFGSNTSGWVVMSPLGKVCAMGDSESEALERFERLGNDFPDSTEDYTHFGKIEKPEKTQDGVEVTVFLKVLTPS